MIPPSNFANAIAPFVPLGRQAVGEEDLELKLRASTLKPMEEAAESARQENRRSPDERTHEAEEQARLSRRGYDSESGESDGHHEDREPSAPSTKDTSTQSDAEDGTTSASPEEAQALIEKADRTRDLQRRLAAMGVSVESAPVGKLFSKNI